MQKRIAYPVEVKEAAIQMKLEGKTTREIMDALNITNSSQVNIWWRWYRNGESYRFSQGVGKQYSYGKGLGELNPQERLQQENKYLRQEIEVLKKYKELEGRWKKKHL